MDFTTVITQVSSVNHQFAGSFAGISIHFGGSGRRFPQARLAFLGVLSGVGDRMPGGEVEVSDLHRGEVSGTINPGENGSPTFC